MKISINNSRIFYLIVLLIACVSYSPVKANNAANSLEVSETFLAKKKKKKRKSKYYVHYVAKGETVKSIAEAYGMKEKYIRKANKRYKKREVKPKVKLRIPYKRIKNDDARKQNIEYKKELQEKYLAKKKKKTTTNSEPEKKAEENVADKKESAKPKDGATSEKSDAQKELEQLRKSIEEREAKVRAKEFAIQQKEKEIERKEKETAKQPETNTQPQNTSSQNSSMTSSGGTFHIIVGSFKNYKSAQRKKSQLSNLGFSAKIFPSKNGWYRVSCSSHKTKEEANSRRNQLYRNNYFKQMWILNQ